MSEKNINESPSVNARYYSKNISLKSSFLVILPGVITNQKQLRAYIKILLGYNVTLPEDETSIIQSVEALENDRGQFLSEEIVIPPSK